MRRVLKPVGLAAVLAVALTVFAPSVHAIECGGIALDDGCLFTITGSDTPEPDDGFAVTNAYGVPMWDFVKERDLEALGYPISQRWVNGPFTLQAFQKVILQWDPGRGRMNYYNTLDALANHYPEIELPFVPAHQVLEADRGADFGTVTQNHLALLQNNPAIKRRFLAEPDWLNLYGLPIRYEEREVDGNPQGVQLLRTQRSVFAIWNVPAPGTAIGRVLLQNLPDQVKKLSDVIIPDRVKHPTTEVNPELAEAIQSLPWVLEEPSPLQQDVLLRLEMIATRTPGLFRYTIQESRQAQVVHSPPTYSAAEVLHNLEIAARFKWAHDGLSENEKYFVDLILRYSIKWPLFVDTILQQTWVTDDISTTEALALDALLQRLMELSPSMEDPQHYRRVDQVFARILSMPLFRTIDGLERVGIEHLMAKYADATLQHPTSALESLESVVEYLESRSALTDEQALLIVYTGFDQFPASLVEGQFQPPRPDYLDAYLDSSGPDRFGLAIDSRLVSLPRSGQVKLVLAREIDYRKLTLEDLEESVRLVERYMASAYPTDVIHLLIMPSGNVGGGDFIGIWSGAYGSLDSGDDAHVKEIIAFHKAHLVHEVAHFYWHGSAPKWLFEGAATLVELRSGFRRAEDRLREIVIRCSVHTVGGIIRSGDTASVYCPYAVGGRLFFELFERLDEPSFDRGFRRLYELTRDRSRASQFGTGVEVLEMHEIGVGLLTQAFVTEAESDAAAIASEVMARWVYGDFSRG